MRPVGGQGHSQCSTVPDHPPVRHSCGGRNPCGLWGVKGTPNARRCARSPACPSFLRRQESMRPVGGQGHSQCSTVPDHPPVRHSCGGRNPCGLWGVKGTPNARRRPITRLSVIPAEAGIHAACGGSRALPMLDGARSPACPSFLRRQESMRPVGGQGHSQCSTAPDHPPVRHSCGGRNPCGLWGVKGTPNARRRPITRLSVIPAEAGIHAGAVGGQGHSQCSTAPDHPPVRHSCGGRNPCGLWGVKGTPNARRRPITRLSVIPAEAGIHAACGGSRALPMLDGARSPACPSFLPPQE